MPDVEIYTLSPAAIRELKRDHRRLAQMVQNLQREVARLKTGYAGPLLHGTADSDIAAMSSLTPGGGTVSMRRWNSAGTALEADADWNETVYNGMSSAITAGSMLHMARDQWGRLWVVSEDCA